MTADLIKFIKERLDMDDLLAHIMIESSWPISVHVVPGESNDDNPQPSVSVEMHGATKRYRRVWWPDGMTEDTWVVHENAIEIWSVDEGQRRLRAVAAKRRILELHKPVPLGNAQMLVCATCQPGVPGEVIRASHLPYPCPTLRLLATEWDNHPDYREEWKL